MTAALRAVLLLGAALLADERKWTGRATTPVDGDTLRVRDADDVVQKIRILGIDAPDEGQPFATAAREHLAKVTRDRDVEIEAMGKDAAGRTVARVRINGNDLAIDMLAAGLAWYHREAIDDPALEAEERRARARTLGLWTDKDPIAPWEWRAAEEARKKKRRKPTTRPVEPQAESATP